MSRLFIAKKIGTWKVIKPNYGEVTKYVLIPTFTYYLEIEEDKVRRIIWVSVYDMQGKYLTKIYYNNKENARKDWAIGYEIKSNKSINDNEV